MKIKNEEIARQLFACLVLDSEYPAYDLGDGQILPPLVCCRVLVDQNFVCNLYAESRQEAIQIFYSGKWKEEKK